MGGDHAPSEVVKGALLAAAEFAVEIILVGQEDVVRRELAAASPTTRATSRSSTRAKS